MAGRSTTGGSTTGNLPSMPPASPARSALKVIVGVLAFCALVTLFSIASCVYFDHRGRKRANELHPASQANLTPRANPEVAASGRDVCSLATNEEVGAALGTVVSSTHNGPSTCRYTSSDNQTVTVQVTWQGGQVALRLSAMAIKARARKAGAVAQLRGIGDEAYVAQQGSTLMFRKADVMVNLNVNSSGKSFRTAVLIAQKLVTRL